MNLHLTDQISGVRIFHAANFAHPVNVYIQDRLVIEGLKYGEVTNYLPVQRGRNNVKIRNTVTGELLYNQTLTIDGDKFITISALSEKGIVDLIVLEDVLDNRYSQSLMNPYLMIPHNYYQLQTMYNPMFQFPYEEYMNPFVAGQKDQLYSCSTCAERQDEIDLDVDGAPAVPILGNSARLRFVHLSINAPAVNLELGSGTRLFTDTRYKQVTNYLPVGAGNVTFNIVRTGTNNILYTTPNMLLLPNKSYTLYAIGILNGSPAFELVLLRDGI